ncbi:two component transcriptional regulator, LuxR family [Amphibacillus marinus]|uniref:Two component transcriptional regulator, LuxR family n=1 Tax=Amphibacillus marinus TaxID=872970 RepID=A0A1H8Q8J5_9BACI|nr:response regulator transcription factor [Amphibacillus marinus]SEO50227.1 two component transcriptional regulator, LuxR family [Amphibacillus marinus]
MKTILIVDDHKMVGEGTKRLLSDEQNLIVDFVSTGAKALEMLDNKEYDLYIIDLNMPDQNGIELTQAIKEKYANARILIYTGYDTSAYFNRLADIGVIGFLSKSYSNEQFVHAVMCALADLAVIPAKWLYELRRTDHSAQLMNGDHVSLTDMEQEVLILVNKGMSNDDIAEHINVSRRTVERYLTKIFQKMNVSSRAEAIETGKKIGVLPEIIL